MDDPARTDDTSQTLVDEGLRCPECEYNLTGLERDVCPECGEGFDRGRLLAELAGAPAPIPIWSRRSEIGGPKAFALTLVEIWFHPARYAERFPTNPDSEEAAAFSGYCLIVATVVASAPALMMARHPIANLLPIVAVIFTHLAIGASICERITAATVFLPIAIGEWVEGWYRRFLGWMRMMRAFMVLSTLCMSVSFLAARLLLPPTQFVSSGITVVVIAVGYWWIAVMRTATHFRRSPLTLLMASLGVPVLYVFGSVSVFIAELFMRGLLL